MSTQDQLALLERAAQALRGHGLTVSVQKDHRPVSLQQAGTWLRVGNHVCGLDYAAVVRSRLKRGAIGAVVNQLRSPDDAGGPLPLLISDHVTPSLARELWEHRQQFVDTTGNVYLEGRGLYVFVSGRKRQEKQRALLASKAYAVARLKVLFALICDPELAAEPLGEIASAADVTGRMLSAVIAELKQRGDLLVDGKRRRLNGRKRLLDDWARAYALGLRVKTLSARYLVPDVASWSDWLPNPERLRWGGESAAVLLGCDLQPGLLTLYGDKLPTRLFIKRRLEPAGPVAYENLLELRKPFWGKSLRVDGPLGTVAPSLVYADLLATGHPRCVEAARMIYHTRLARLFPEI
ncbi:MAG TPA: type IV toxin-antitoxin system AbiEi family antitoxin [Accumulibacter sp.]|nr:type IV toxin-antitoxin system AbiEi family antitoxin [Accumulibacter sp.]HQC81316.1 type IV toxin-antitoxin system AbiEi family antitoxin [Accumulibacter sp.]